MKWICKYFSVATGSLLPFRKAKLVIKLGIFFSASSDVCVSLTVHWQSLWERQAKTELRPTVLPSLCISDLTYEISKLSDLLLWQNLQLQTMKQLFLGLLMTRKTKDFKMKCKNHTKDFGTCQYSTSSPHQFSCLSIIKKWRQFSHYLMWKNLLFFSC